MTSAAETSPILPQELCDAIIDNIGSLKRCPPFIEVWWEPEPQTLMRCTLVCRAWRLRAQFWLFRRIWLMDVESLHKLECVLDRRSEYLPIVRAIELGCGDAGRYPVQNVLAAVATLARRCLNLKQLSLIATSVGEPGRTIPHCHAYLPFNLRLHSALFRQSFGTVTVLILFGVQYHTFTDFVSFISLFVALEKLAFDYIECEQMQRLKDSDFIISLKQRKHVLNKLRNLRAVCHSSDEI